MIVDDLNKQRVENDLVELFIFTISGTNYYFTNYHTQVTFRDYINNAVVGTYIPLPIEFTGYEHKSEGAYARPRLIVANVLSTFKDQVGISNDGLLGAKVVRRRTLADNLTSNPPVELPIQSFIIDRIESETPLTVTFELTTAFDLAGVSIPSRIIVPNTCPWFYQGAASDRSGEKIGGCTFKEASNNSVLAYFDINNNWLSSGVDSNFTTYAGTAVKGNLYKVSGTVTRNNVGGGTTSVSANLYYQALVGSSGTFNIANFRRVKLYTVWDTVTSYVTYSDSNYNNCVIRNNKIYMAINPNQNKDPLTNSYYWKRIDLCGKKLTSCAIRFRAKIESGVVSVDLDNTKELPYGGFPAARRYSR
ncbi:phage minor tail protein L [bacterium]|nr:phage minor tail protein L [bacterium]